MYGGVNESRHGLDGEVVLELHPVGRLTRAVSGHAQIAVLFLPRTLFHESKLNQLAMLEVSLCPLCTFGSPRMLRVFLMFALLFAASVGCSPAPSGATDAENAEGEVGYEPSDETEEQGSMTQGSTTQGSTTQSTGESEGEAGEEG